MKAVLAWSLICAALLAAALCIRHLPLSAPKSALAGAVFLVTTGFAAHIAKRHE